MEPFVVRYRYHVPQIATVLLGQETEPLDDKG